MEFTRCTGMVRGELIVTMDLDMVLVKCVDQGRSTRTVQKAPWPPMLTVVFFFEVRKETSICHEECENVSR